MAYTTSDYEIRATKRGTDTLPTDGVADSFSGQLGTWLPLSAAQSWSISLDPTSADGSYLRTIDFDIRNKNTGEIVSTTSGDFILQAAVADGYVESTINGGVVSYVVKQFDAAAGTAKASITFTTGGAVTTAVTSSNATLDATKTQTVGSQTWYQGIVDSSLYQIKASATNIQVPSGPSNVFGGTLGSWIDLDVNRVWDIELGVNDIDGSYDANLTFEIREKASTTVVTTTSGTFKLDATLIDQDPGVPDTLTGDTAKIVIDKFNNASGVATVTIRFNTDGTYEGIKTATNATQGSGGETFTGTWFDENATASTTDETGDGTVDTGSGSGGYETGGGSEDYNKFFDPK